MPAMHMQTSTIWEYTPTHVKEGASSDQTAKTLSEPSKAIGSYGEQTCGNIIRRDTTMATSSRCTSAKGSALKFLF